MKISSTVLDKKFSLYIRNRDGWCCQRCQKQYKPPTNALHCAHMFSRRHYGTRFNNLNACALCYGCHSFIDSHPIEKIEFFKELIGETDFDVLRWKSQQYCNKKDTMFKAQVWLKSEGL